MVVGTVIDPELEDELRLTVVATGLGQPQQHQAQRPRAVARRADGQVDDGEMDRPTVMRTARKAAGDGVGGGGREDDIEYLDIQAFLRRQAD